VNLGKVVRDASRKENVQELENQVLLDIRDLTGFI
jgi:hypothetical protein